MTDAAQMTDAELAASYERQAQQIERVLAATDDEIFTPASKALIEETKAHGVYLHPNGEQVLRPNQPARQHIPGGLPG